MYKRMIEMNGQQVDMHSLDGTTWFSNVQSTANGKSYGFDVISINQNGKDEKHLVFSCKIHAYYLINQGSLDFFLRFKYRSDTLRQINSELTDPF